MKSLENEKKMELHACLPLLHQLFLEVPFFLGGYDSINNRLYKWFLEQPVSRNRFIKLAKSI
jgi:hypothetical protein